MATNKQTYLTEQYIKKLRERKEEYATRLEYVADHKIPVAGGTTVGTATGGEGTGSAVPDEGVFTGGSGDDSRGLITLGKTKMKAPYVFGAAGPNVFDCSGFVTWVYNKCGYKFGRSNAQGFYNMFAAVSEPKLGDLVFFSNTYKPGISHIGIWMGNNEMLHTANVKNGVQISKLDSYWKSKKPEFRSAEKYYEGTVSANPTGEAEVQMFAAMAMNATSEDDISTIGDEASFPPQAQEGYFESEGGVVPYTPVKFRGSNVVQSRTSRSVFLHNRIGWARNTNMEGLLHLNKERFIHHTHYDGHEGNLYSPDAKRLFESLLLKTKKPYFEVISGFRFSEPGQLSPHEAGCAMDILVKDLDEVREIADCAWLLGVRSIAIGGNFEEDKGFIHLDIAPKGKDFSYEGVPIYGGPGKWNTK